MFCFVCPKLMILFNGYDRFADVLYIPRGGCEGFHLVTPAKLGFMEILNEISGLIVQLTVVV